MKIFCIKTENWTSFVIAKNAVSYVKSYRSCIKSVLSYNL